ncbi:MAG TPA: hypothetical protein VN442_16325 [Bryobacteraceae bacterium]|nr:hypothetical protein [Bryobacteraceae bacterium]
MTLRKKQARVLSAAAVCLFAAGWQVPPRRGSGAQPKGYSMELKVTLSPGQAEVIVGESIPVAIRIQNAGNVPVEVPHHLGPSPFEFVVRAAKDGRVVRRLSERRAAGARYGEPEREMAIPTEMLAPGAGFEYQDDLAGLMPSALGPGEYRISASVAGAAGSIESGLSPLIVKAPRVRALAAVFDPVGRLEQVLAHEPGKQQPEDEQQPAALLQNTSREDAPQDGTWYRRIEQATDVRSVAVAAPLDAGQRLRWFAWLAKNAIGAAASEQRYLAKSIDPVPLGVEAASLQETGWQIADNRALFAAVGVEAGHVSLAAATFDRQTGASIRRVRLAAAAQPAIWAARYRAQPPARFDVVWAEEREGRTRICRQAVMPERGAAEQPVVLIERREQVAAIAMESVAGATAGVVDVLLGPVGDDARMVLLRLPLGGGAPLVRWEFRAPSMLDKSRPSEWMLPRAPLADPVVFARLRNGLMMRHASEGSEWSDLPDSAAAGILRLEAAQDRLWAIWTDPRQGLVYRMIP